MVNHDKNIIIRTEKLCKSFSTKNHSEHILKNIDLEIYERDFTVVMGASGSGKSTLLYMLSGMDRPSLGRVFFRDEEISGKSNNALSDFRRNHCGFVFQQINLIHNLTVLDNIVLCGLLRNKNNAEVMQKAIGIKVPRTFQEVKHKELQLSVRKSMSRTYCLQMNLQEH